MTGLILIEFELIVSYFSDRDTLSSNIVLLNYNESSQVKYFLFITHCKLFILTIECVLKYLFG